MHIKRAPAMVPALNTLPSASLLQMLLLLSDDELVHVMTFLPFLLHRVSVERVCQRLRQVLHNINILIRDHEDLLAAANEYGFSHTSTSVKIHTRNVVTLAKSLKINAVLIKLHLQFNSIGSYGAILLARALKANTVLHDLQLGGNDIRDAGVEALGDALKFNSTLRVLNLYYNDIGNAGATALGEALNINTVLNKLNLGGNNIRYEGITRLTYSLQVNASLDELDLSGNNIDDEGLLTLAEALEFNMALKNLSVSYNKSHTSASAAKKLAKGVLASNTIEVLSDVPIKELREDTLTRLNLAWKGLADTEAIVISEITKNSAMLSFLDLSANHRISDVGATALANTLKVNTALNTVSLWHTSVGDKGATAIAQALRVNNVLTNLNLRICDIGDIGTVALADTLKVNNILKYLDIRVNNIGATGYAALHDALKVNTSTFLLK